MKLRRVDNKYGAYHTFDGFLSVEEAIFAARNPTKVAKHPDLRFAQKQIDDMRSKSIARMRVNVIKTIGPDMFNGGNVVTILNRRSKYYPVLQFQPIRKGGAEDTPDAIASPVRRGTSGSETRRTSLGPQSSYGSPSNQRIEPESSQGSLRTPLEAAQRTPISRGNPQERGSMLRNNSTEDMTRLNPASPASPVTRGLRSSSRNNSTNDMSMLNPAASVARALRFSSRSNSTNDMTRLNPAPLVNRMVENASDSAFKNELAVNYFLSALNLMNSPFLKSPSSPSSCDGKLKGRVTVGGAPVKDFIARNFTDYKHYTMFRTLTDLKHDFKMSNFPYNTDQEMLKYQTTVDTFFACVVIKCPRVYKGLKVMNMSDDTSASKFKKGYISKSSIVIDTNVDNRFVHKRSDDDRCEDAIPPSANDDRLVMKFTVGNFMDPHSIKGNIDPSMRTLVYARSVLHNFFKDIFHESPVSFHLKSEQDKKRIPIPELIDVHNMDDENACDYTFRLRIKEPFEEVCFQRSDLSISSVLNDKSKIAKFVHNLLASTRPLFGSTQRFEVFKKFYRMCFKSLGDHIQLHELLMATSAHSGKTTVPSEADSLKAELVDNKVVLGSVDRMLIADAMFDRATHFKNVPGDRPKNSMPVLFALSKLDDKFEDERYHSTPIIPGTRTDDSATWKRYLFFHEHNPNDVDLSLSNQSIRAKFDYYKHIVGNLNNDVLVLGVKESLIRYIDDYDETKDNASRICSWIIVVLTGRFALVDRSDKFNAVRALDILFEMINQIHLNLEHRGRIVSQTSEITIKLQKAYDTVSALQSKIYALFDCGGCPEIDTMIQVDFRKQKTRRHNPNWMSIYIKWQLYKTKIDPTINLVDFMTDIMHKHDSKDQMAYNDFINALNTTSARRLRASTKQTHIASEVDRIKGIIVSEFTKKLSRFMRDMRTELSGVFFDESILGNFNESLSTDFNNLIDCANGSANQYMSMMFIDGKFSKDSIDFRNIFNVSDVSDRSDTGTFFHTYAKLDKMRAFANKEIAQIALQFTRQLDSSNSERKDNMIHFMDDSRKRRSFEINTRR